MLLKRDDREHRGEHRHDARDAAVRFDEPRVASLVDHADEEEQRAGRDAVVDHDHQRALHALHGEREDAEHDEAEVADRRIRDELLEVRLDERHERAVHDADHRQPEDGRRESPGLIAAVGKERDGEAHEAERAELEHDARQHHRAGGRRFDVRVGQPRMEREHRHLHGEREEEGAEQPLRRGRRDRRVLQHVVVVEVRRCPSPDSRAERPRYTMATSMSSEPTIV